MWRLLKVISYWVRSWFQTAEQKISNPIRDSQFQIEDAEKAKDEFEGRVAKLLAANRKLERDLISRQGEARKWSEVATKAAQSNNTADARVALTNQVSAEQEIAFLQKELLSSRAEAEQLKIDLQICDNKIDSAKRNSTRFAARLESANIRQAINSNKSDLSSAFSALNELELKANEAVDMADANTELSSGAGTLLEKYDTQGHDQIIEQKLALLMAPK